MWECRLCHVPADLLHANSVAVAQETAEDSFKKHGATILCQDEQNFMPLGFWLKVVVFGVSCVCFFYVLLSFVFPSLGAVIWTGSNLVKWMLI